MSEHCVFSKKQMASPVGTTHYSVGDEPLRIDIVIIKLPLYGRIIHHVRLKYAPIQGQRLWYRKIGASPYPVILAPYRGHGLALILFLDRVSHDNLVAVETAINRHDAVFA